MVEQVGRSSGPWWVRFGRWGTSGRAALWMWFAVSVALAVGCVAAGFVLGGRWFLGATFLLPAAWYWLTVRWVDRHGSWTGGRPSSVRR